ncbi:hypothetical protein PCE1_000842 [Barthelona sp. PCE]
MAQPIPHAQLTDLMKRAGIAQNPNSLQEFTIHHKLKKSLIDLPSNVSFTQFFLFCEGLFGETQSDLSIILVTVDSNEEELERIPIVTRFEFESALTSIGGVKDGHKCIFILEEAPRKGCCC